MDFALHPPTRFAPAGRESIDRIHEEHLMVDSLRDRLDDDSAVAVVNESRQIVHANAPFLRFVHARSLEEVLGLRLGEVLGCIHATEDTSGCGTHPSCAMCGTINATLSALTGRACIAEVNMRREVRGHEKDLDFDLEATPLLVRARLFVRMTVTPIDGQHG